MLARHHADRLDEAVALGRERPMTVAELTRRMFHRPLDPHQMRFASGEALAHLNRLLRSGTMARETDADGVHWFRTV
jgi:hypothetical protein